MAVLDRLCQVWIKAIAPVKPVSRCFINLFSLCAAKGICYIFSDGNNNNKKTVPALGTGVHEYGLFYGRYVQPVRYWSDL